MVSVTQSGFSPSGDRRDLDQWLDALSVKHSGDELDRLRRVGDYVIESYGAEETHDEQHGFGHALAVAVILGELGMDAETLAAGLLHGVVSEGRSGLEEVREKFGEGIASLVEGVLRMDAIREHQQASGADETADDHVQAESLRRMLLAMVQDVRVVIIKLALRLHNMRIARNLTAEEQRIAARETLDIFAPLANRLSIWQLKWELEDLAFRYLQPDIYKQLAKNLAERRVDRERYLDVVVKQLRDALQQHGVEAEVSSRPKHLYSIWKKMQRKGVGFDEIFDVRAVRILVNEVRDCYAALGVVHGMWQNISREFDDYIANPKQNLYRSLHTAVVGPEGRTLEVQIRTREMHEHAELGVAAHWRYKEGVSRDPGFERKINWMRQLLEWRDEVADSAEFLEHFRSESSEERVYVYSPQGKIVDLPAGATPLDFAYRIHTEIGHRCRGAKVDGRIVPLTYTLKNGEQVEILTTKQGKPSRDWLSPHLGYLATSRARAKVRHWFAEQDHDKNLSAGRAVLDRELQRLGVSDAEVEKLVTRFRYPKLEDLQVAIGRGEVSTAQIARALEEIVAPAEEPGLPARPKRSRTPKTGSDVHIEGVGDLLTQIAKCCKPVPNDPIVGFITRGRGVTIHRQTCPNVLRIPEESRDRLIEVAWGGEVSRHYPVDIQVQAYDRPGLLRDITNLLANERINVVSMSTTTDRREHMAHMSLRLEIEGLDQLSRVLAKISKLPNVVSARRRS
ncbi:MAG: GTP diphosphokinase [Gammaproteobacteria bacterium]